jgi:hypothetical protein
VLLRQRLDLVVVDLAGLVVEPVLYGIEQLAGEVDLCEPECGWTLA